MDSGRAVHRGPFLGWLLSVWLSVVSSQTCHRLDFSEIADSRGSGVVLAEYPSLPLGSCRRVCRQYWACFSYSVQWSVVGQTGSCRLHHGTGRFKHGADTGWSFFYSCPGSLAYDPVVQGCYGLNKTTVYWADAKAQCESIHPEVHLARAQTAEEWDLISAITYSSNSAFESTWTDGYGWMVSGQMEFSWSTTGEPVTGETWTSNAPYQDPARHCLIIRRHNGLVNNQLCTRLFWFICQM